MADYGFDGMIKVSFVPTIASLSAPTTAELSAGTPLEDVLTPDGLTISSDTANIDTSKLSATFTTNIIGRSTFTLGIKYVRGTDAKQTALETALIKGANGYLVVRRDVVASTAWTAAQKVEIYPCQVGEANPDSPAPNALQTVAIPLTNTAPPKTLTNRATVA
jgi:hypothetical protein